jgi:hypothetical protein
MACARSDAEQDVIKELCVRREQKQVQNALLQLLLSLTNSIPL